MDKIKHASNIIKKSQKILVLTGAGISTESGIADFRSKEGIYNKAPEDILSRNFFFDKPNVFFEFYLRNLYHPKAKPNEGHKILADWDKEGKIMNIITQNIDGFHQEAGATNVIEFHGSIKTATCYNRKCQKKYTIKELTNRINQKEKYWECDCGKSSTKRYIKPDIVLFDDVGTWMSKGRFHEIRTMAWESDLILVLGTTLQVYPFNQIVRYRNLKTPTIIINKGETEFDNEKNTTTIKESIGETLTKIKKQMVE